MLPFPFAFPFGAAGDDWKKSGDEDGIFCRLAWGVACTDVGRDRRGAGEDILGRWSLMKMSCGDQLTVGMGSVWRVRLRRVKWSRVFLLRVSSRVSAPCRREVNLNYLP